ncbi:MAG: transglycosylase SLT domain-containing protein [Acidimicrobiia bacterium]|nr:transglycosylase SLT domain-containing protein [Acidimicrobiia bacterium]
MTTEAFQALLATAQAEAQRLGLTTAMKGTTSTGATAFRTASAGGGQSVVDTAMEYLGVPYVWGGESLDEGGLDCSGLVQLVFGRLGVDVPRTADYQAEIGTPVASLAEARPGDLVAFGDPVTHIGIYVGNDHMIHAPQTGDVVKVAPITREPTAIRRVSVPSAVSASSAQGPAGLYSTAGSAASAGLPAGTPYADLFRAAGARHGVDPALVAAVAKAESGFDPSATSPAGALGLMQFMPSTAAGIGIDPLDPAQAIDGGAHYLAAQLERFGSVELALAAYNAGPGAVESWGGVPPYRETQNYVAKVLDILAGGA